MDKEDLSGQRFGSLVAVKRVQPTGRANAPHWECLCDCGVSKVFINCNLTKGRTKSCGCTRMASIAAAVSTHGMCYSPEFKAWSQMKERCLRKTNKSYPVYGGRGIKVHPEWAADFQSFFDHVGARPSPKHSLDRIDVNGNYAPGNLRWATQKEQTNNKRTNLVLEHDGLSLTCAQWAEKLGLNIGTLWSRLDKGWSVERAIMSPIDTRKRNSNARKLSGDYMGADK